MAKKNDKFSKMIKKRAYIYIILILVTSIFSLANLTVNSFALWFETRNQPNDNLISTGCFNITYNDLDKNGKSTSINLLNSYPISEKRGVSLKPYTFTIKNICNIKGEYRVVLSQLDNSSLDNKYLRYTFNEYNKAIVVEPLPLESNTSLDNNTLAIINEKNKPNSINNNYILVEDNIEPNEEKTYNFRLWLDQSAGNDQMEKEFEGVISISSIAIN